MRIGKSLLLVSAILIVGSVQITHGASISSKQQAMIVESKENIDAATVLYQKGITKVAPANTAFYETLTRKSAALLVKRFATNILNKTSDKSNCSFSDISSLNSSDQKEIIDTCNMGVFKGSNGMFSPNETFSRGQLVTVIARLISNNGNMEKDEAYDYLLHLGVVTVDDRNDSDKASLRKDLYIMMHRIITSISQLAAYSPYMNGIVVGNTTSTHTDNTDSSANITADNEKQVLKIIGYKKDSIYGNYAMYQLGSAVMIASNKIITNAHVVLDENDELLQNYEICKTILSDSKPVCFTTATVDYYDKDNDLALLTIAGSATTLPKPVKITASAPRNGDDVQVLGYPGIGGNSITFTKGSISGIEKDKYKSDVKIDHGNSGGGAFNKKGELIGVPNSAMEDTDTLAYIIPYTTVQAFLKKEGEIIANETANTDTTFVTYIGESQAQRNSKAFATPYFSIGSLGIYSIDTYSFDKIRGLYQVSLSTQDSKTRMSIETMVQTGKPIPKEEYSKYFEDIGKQCSTTVTGTTMVGSYTGEYFRCDDYYGEKNTIRVLEVNVNPEVKVHAEVYSDSSNKKNGDNAESFVKGMTITNEVAPKFDMYNVGPITYPQSNNLNIHYSLGNQGDVNSAFELVNTPSSVSITTTLQEIPEKTFNITYKDTTLKGYGDDYFNFYSQYYDLILSGTLVKNSNDNTFYMLAFTDKKEDLEKNDKPTRNFIAQSYVSYNNHIFKLSLRASYEGTQNAEIEQQILGFIDQLKIAGTNPIKDLGGTPISITNLTIK